MRYRLYLIGSLSWGKGFLCIPGMFYRNLSCVDTKWLPVSLPIPPERSFYKRFHTTFIKYPHTEWSPSKDVLVGFHHGLLSSTNDLRPPEVRIVFRPSPLRHPWCPRITVLFGPCHVLVWFTCVFVVFCFEI